MSEEKALYNRFLRKVLILGSASLGEDDEAAGEAELYLDGTSRVIPRLENPDLDRLMSLLQTLEEKGQLVRIISHCLSDSVSGPSVTIGLEDHLPGMKNWTLITSTYQYDRKTQGSLGILGPSRMEYERTISLVDCVARLFEEVLRGN